MRVCDFLKERDFVLSFEFFPPKRREDEDAFWDTIEKLKRWKPDFVSVTYGAGGSTHDRSIDLALALLNKGFCVVAHLTSISLSREQVKKTLDILKAGGIENILALRGDIPKDPQFVIPKDAFRYAYQLVEFIKANYDFCVGVAGYPEGHIEAPSREKDIEYLKLKVDKGAEFIITQLFFDNKFFFEFLELTQKAGINVPIIPGIMPITNYNQIIRFTKLCGATIPNNLLSLIESLKDKPDELRRAGIEYTINQCRELIDMGVKYLHFYTLNKSPATNIILEALGIKR